MRTKIAAVALLGALAGAPTPPSWGALPPRERVAQGVIVPGRSVGGLTLGAPAPAERELAALRRREGTAVEVQGGNVVRITVSSDRYTVERSGLRPGAPLAEVLRFYGSGSKDLREGFPVLTYRAQGIEFSIDPAADRVRSIAVFRPVRLKAPVEQYRKLYQYKEQFKAR